MHGATPNTMTYPVKESRPKKQKREQASSLLTDFCNLPLEAPLQHFCCILWDFPGGASDKESACQCRRHETWVRSLGWEDPLEEGMATHPSILAWRILRTEEPSGLQHMGSPRVKHNWGDLAHIYFIYYKWLTRSSLHLQGGAFISMNTAGGDHWEASSA